MRTKRYFTGLDNSRKIRVIVNGVGFVTTVSGVFAMCFTSQRKAVSSVLATLGLEQHLPENKRPSGLARRTTVFDETGKQVEYDIQVDLI